METKYYKSLDIENIKIKQKSCDLNLKISDSENEEIKISYNESSNVSFYQSGNSLFIENKETKSFFLSFFNQKDDIEITIPKNKNVFISILNGDIYLTGTTGIDNLNIVQNIKKFEVKQTSGDLTILNIVSNHATLNTVSGDIECKNSFFNNAQIKGISSDISLDNFGCQYLTISTISGDIELKITSVFKNIKINSKSGDIEIYQPSSQLNYKLNSFSGDVEINNVNFNDNASTLVASTLSGDIELNIIKPIYSENIFQNFKDTSQDDIVKANFSNKIDEKNKILDMLLNNKISEKDATNLLKSLDCSEEEIHNFFEEFLFLKMKKNEENSENKNINNSDAGNNNSNQDL